MDDTNELLRRLITQSEENNKLLRRIDRRARWSIIYSVVRWLIVLGLGFGVYYYIQPYLEEILRVYADLLLGADKLRNSGIQQFFNR
jgi:hypothetical protein